VPIEGLHRSDYFTAAFDILAESGHDGLTIPALCHRLGVTKGSFYHHFDSLSEFVDALLDYWAAEHATRLIRQSEAATDIFEQYQLLKGIAIGLPHGAEAAIRAWGWSNPHVAAAQRQVDETRLTHLTHAAEGVGLTAERAALMAKISMSIMIGMQQLEQPASPESMQEVFAELERWNIESIQNQNA
jgi:AcrR family transcriptional regulator